MYSVRENVKKKKKRGDKVSPTEKDKKKIPEGLGVIVGVSLRVCSRAENSIDAVEYSVARRISTTTPLPIQAEYFKQSYV